MAPGEKAFRYLLTKEDSGGGMVGFTGLCAG